MKKAALGVPSSTFPAQLGCAKQRTTQHRVAQANASRVELGLDPGTVAVLLQQEGFSPSQHGALVARHSLKSHKNLPLASAAS